MPRVMRLEERVDGDSIGRGKRARTCRARRPLRWRRTTGQRAECYRNAGEAGRTHHCIGLLEEGVLPQSSVSACTPTRALRPSMPDLALLTHQQNLIYSNHAL